MKTKRSLLRVLVLLLACVLLTACWRPVPAQAEAAEYAAKLYRNNQYSSPAFVVDTDNGLRVYCKYTDGMENDDLTVEMSSGKRYAVGGEGHSYSLTISGTMYVIADWGCKDSSVRNDVGVMKVAAPASGEELYLLHTNVGQTKVEMTAQRLTDEFDEESDDFPAIISITDRANMEEYPGAFVTQDMQCKGIVFDKGYAICPWFVEAVFTAGVPAEEPTQPVPTTAPAAEPEQEPEAEPAEEEKAEEEDEEGEDDDDDDDGKQKLLILGGAALGAAVLIGIAVFLILKKKSGDQNNTSSAGGYAVPGNFGVPAGSDNQFSGQQGAISFNGQQSGATESFIGQQGSNAYDGGATIAFNGQQGAGPYDYGTDPFGSNSFGMSGTDSHGQTFGNNVSFAPKPLYLVCEDGIMRGRTVTIGQNPVTIGRSDPAVSKLTICYPKDTPGVSHHHAVLMYRGDKLFLLDNTSSYGTYINGVGKLTPDVPYEVGAGTVFYIAEKKNRFSIRE